MLQAVFARILQSADKFCRIFPCKMSEFSMFYKLFGCMHACILHVLSVRFTKEFQHDRKTRSVFKITDLNYQTQSLPKLQARLLASRVRSTAVHLRTTL